MPAKNTLGIVMLIVVVFLQPLSAFATEPNTNPSYQMQSPEAVNLTPKGYLTTPQELSQILSKANRNIEPFASNVATLIDQADSPSDWDYGTVSGEFYVSSGKCVARNTSQGDNFLNATEGGHEVYRKMLAYYMTGNLNFAISARQKILDLTDTHSFGGNDYSADNECILFLGFTIPIWIQAADLLGNTSIWSNSDKIQFQNWLAEEIYPKVAWASRVRSNNWGSAGSLSAAMIADYVSDRGNLTLTEVKPQARSLSPANAYAQHNAQQLARMNGSFRGDSQCNIWGIQAYGGIPDELRRGSTGCTGKWLDDTDSSWSYTTTQVEHLVFHAEFLRHRNDFSMYNNITGTGMGSLTNAMLFIISNPINLSASEDWVDSRKGTLLVAYSYYGLTTLWNTASTIDTFKGGTTLPYAKLTHEGGLKVTSSLPDAPTLLSPAHRTHTTNRRPTFGWSNVPNVQAYRIIIYNEDHSFQHKARVTGRTYTPSVNLVREKLQWRVRSQDVVTGKFGNYSGRFTLFIDAPTVAISAPQVVISTPSTLTRIEASATSINVNGKWQTHQTDVASGGAYLYSSGQLTDTLSLNFTGQQVGVVYVQHPSLGKLVLEVDGIIRQTISTQGNEAFGQSMVLNHLGAGDHVLRVYSEDAVIAVDAFLVEATSPVLSATQVGNTPIPTLADASTAIAPTLENSSPTPMPTLVPPTATALPQSLPFVEIMEGGATTWLANGNWQLVKRDMGQAWQTLPANAPSTLTLNRAINLAGASAPQLSFDTQYSGEIGQAWLEVSSDNLNWTSLTPVMPNMGWTNQVVDLSAYRGQMIYVRFTLLQLPATDDNGTATVVWGIDNVAGYELPPQATLVSLPTLQAPATATIIALPGDVSNVTPIPPVTSIPNDIPATETPMPMETIPPSATPGDEVLATAEVDSKQ